MVEFPRADERARMVERQIAARGIRNPRVLAVMRQIPRHIFIPPPYDKSAYDDNPLPIGNGQTISQPYIVALMTELLDPKPEDTILEIGAGCGYQAAILAALAKQVVTIERLPAIAELARVNLAKLGIGNATVIIGDGTTGNPAAGPFDGIIITAATPQVPKPLLAQLAEGGRLVAPAGSRDVQELVRIVKKGEQFKETYHGGVRFVPLIGEYGWDGSNA